MIRAHMATFPPRAGILMQTVATILPQVDRLCICLNQYARIPDALRDDPRIEAMIPADDLLDAGKFAFTPGDDDMVFTIDDDILYPSDYVAHTLQAFDDLDPARDVAGYLGHAWVMKPKKGRPGWRNYMIQKRVPQIFKVDVLGTGTACQLGRNLPRLKDISTAAGFVDLRHARLHGRAGRSLWVLPRGDDYLRPNLPDELAGTSLFETVNRQLRPDMMREQKLLMQERSPHSGLKLDLVRKREGG
ncbi:hypothetical protein [Paracoccus marinaquae]|uniref:Glycosyl transferase family 2 n=1 Tax=Paracoccus marinaquae TaxID=2841926 RepID=A0ABS6AKA5_9RHOB|nr:hypothetical protein [Paracoccus marinaquae]MBU3030934.1 hypothetical protein [Paracoccus marinaquae]